MKNKEEKPRTNERMNEWRNEKRTVEIKWSDRRCDSDRRLESFLKKREATVAGKRNKRDENLCFYANKLL